MALDPIVQGCDWIASLLIEPTTGKTNADVVALLDGATVEAKLYSANAVLVATGVGEVISSDDRSVRVTFDNSTTSTLAEQIGCILDVRVANGSQVFPVQVRERLTVRALTGSP